MYSILASFLSGGKRDKKGKDRFFLELENRGFSRYRGRGRKEKKPAQKAEVPQKKAEAKPIKDVPKNWYKLGPRFPISQQ